MRPYYQSPLPLPEAALLLSTLDAAPAPPYNGRRQRLYCRGAQLCALTGARPGNGCRRGDWRVAPAEAASFTARFVTRAAYNRDFSRGCVL